MPILNYKYGTLNRRYLVYMQTLLYIIESTYNYMINIYNIDAAFTVIGAFSAGLKANVSQIILSSSSLMFIWSLEFDLFVLALDSDRHY